jgi:predicted Zn-dependent protease
MFRLPSRRSLLVVAALAAFAAFAVVASANNTWSRYHWARTSNPFTLRVGNNVSSSWNTAFNTAVADWNSSSVLNLTTVAGTAGSNCAMVPGTVQVCNAAYGANGWLGLASINIAGGTRHITQATAKMNDTYFNTATYNNPNERLHVMCQEVGHTFGLDHQSTNGRSLNTCMDYFSNTGSNATSTLSTHPNQHDYDQLVSIYSHLDSSTTIAANARGGAGAEQSGAEWSNSEVTDDPNSWGMLVRQSASGRSSEYERYNSDGSRTLTHVFWTEEAAARNPGGDHRYDQ